jgi:hypothetical protein
MPPQTKTKGSSKAYDVSASEELKPSLARSQILHKVKLIICPEFGGGGMVVRTYKGLGVGEFEAQISVPL